VRVDVLPAGGETFRVDVSGARGKSLFLYRERRLVEARSNIAEDCVCVDELAKGDYLLFVRDAGSFQITVK
jgi:hypothetical protein